ncbi:hypothetical protein BW730_15130 [Tessaracoccus aquimaris]|uniref:VanZ-like domain-containing protein n=1 Tax=Tessaracoccus aquimaris TaxID=1332264 RepID=A0A1Q2CR81_9ACTN|nr:VanZ family protein [Tessaracoccus aquimaris]AQP48638.1 hypothetical protein BW730_15130 [Tessaracoccus aquimaris]
MIDAWTQPAIVAVLLGGVGFVALFVPILVWESRRHGQIRVDRVIGAAMVAVFAVALLAYTLLPFPDKEWCSTHRLPGRNLDPLEVVRDNLDYLREHGARRLLRSFVFLQAALNVLLFVPFGALARRYFGIRAGWTILLGFATSVLIEAAQGTGAFGLLPCRYRVADIDDVILNTLGTVIGAVAAPLLLFFVTDARATARSRGHARQVTRRRRLIGMLIDGFSFVVLPAAVLIGYRLVDTLLLGAPATSDDAGASAVATLVGFVVLLVPTLVGSGASVGQRAVWLEPEWEARPRRALRSLCGFGGWMLVQVLASIPGLPDVLRTPLDLLSVGLAVAAVIAVLADPSARGLSYLASRARIEDSREAD